MSKNVDTSGSYQRPTLIDYLVVLEQEELEISLHVHVGTLEVGVVSVQQGAVVHANLPGATGDSALKLISQLPNTRISPEVWTNPEPNITAPWRDLIPVQDYDQSVDRRQRLSLVRAELRELDAELAAESGVYELPTSEPGPIERKALRIVGSLFDWSALDAYLDDDIEDARSIMQKRTQIASDPIALANLERLRLRLLDDELAADFAEVSK